MKLNEMQQRGYELAVKGENLFITGSGGCGKSVLVNKIMQYLGGRCVAVAPTAIAGLNINASTIHSQFKFPLGYMYKSRRENVNQKIMDLFSKSSNVTTLIIDEISMVRADTFVAINKALQKARRSKAPFGGVQVIVVGDFFQLPPVINKNNSEGQLFFKEFRSEFCFATNDWNDAGLTMIELSKVMRQTDEEHIMHLQNIRQKLPGWQDSVKYFNHHGADTSNIKNPVIMCTTNNGAALYNLEFYNDIKAPERTFYANKSHGYTDLDPVPYELSLKVGCKVMCRANTEEMINGETGIVEDISNDMIIIKKTNGQIARVKKQTWSQIEYSLDHSSNEAKTDVIGTFEQFPLMLGYASTIHKSQGLTLPEVALELGKGCFASGQLYVALSRCKTIEGFGCLDEIRNSDVIVNSEVIKFYERERNRTLDLI